MSKFIVLRIGWEYDDCKYIYAGLNHPNHDHDLDDVVGEYSTREEAEDAAIEFAAKDLPGMYVRNHGYEPEDIFDASRNPELIEILGLNEESESPYDVLLEWWHNSGLIPSNISHEQALELVRCLGIELYEVVECGIVFY